MSLRQIARVRRMCLMFPETTERLSHGEPTFFVHGKVFVMCANNHHGDGRVAVWVPAPPGAQEALTGAEPEIFFRPPYVGCRGWIGIELRNIRDDDLKHHIRTAWERTAPKRLLAGLVQAPNLKPPSATAGRKKPAKPDRRPR